MHTQIEMCVWGRILSSTVGLQYHEVQAFLPHEPQTQSKHEPNSMPPKKTLKENTMKTSFKSEMFNKIHVKIK